MTGEKRRLRTKRCLSRNKRSKTNNEQTEDSVGDSSAGRSSDCSGTEICGTVAPSATSEVNQGVLPTCTNHLKDVFEFNDDDDDDDNDDDDDDDTDGSGRSNSNKRKRSDAEEIATSVKPKFKRAYKALKRTKPFKVLQRKYKDDPFAKDESETCIENLPGIKENAGTENISSVGQSSTCVVSDVMAKQVPQTKIVIHNKLAGNADAPSVCQVDFQSRDDNNQLHGRGNNSKQHICPVCGFVFLVTEAMDNIYKHINSCLDGASDGVFVSKRTEERFDPYNEYTSEVGNCSAQELFGDDLFFCQLCQKDLSKMNSQRRQQHINRCCDQSVKTKENETPATIQAHTVNQLQCPICSKSFKSSKSRQTHIKKCAQQSGIGTNQLLEIIHQEKQSGTDTAGSGRVEKMTGGNSNMQNEKRIGGVKRKKNTTLAQRDLDNDTRLALALSASMASQPAPAKSRGRRNKNGNKFPALLLRNDEEAQTVVAMRAAQVLCVQENADDDEISCTPALAPSRLTDQTVQQFGTVNKCLTVHEDSENDGTSNAQERGTGDLKEPSSCAVTVDSSLSKSFLCSLYNSEIGNETFKQKELAATPLWSLAAAKHQTSDKFYVPGLLPPELPRREEKALYQKRACTTSAKSNSDTVGLNRESQNEDREDVECAVIKEDSSSHEAKEGYPGELQIKNTEGMEITPSQAINVDLLLELVEDDDVHHVSMETQPTSAGVCVDMEQQEEDRDATAYGKSKLLLDLSSMVNNSYLSDVSIVLKHGLKLMAHRFMLCLRSDVLAQMLIDQGGVDGIGGQACLKFEEVDQSVFEFVLRHIYTGDVTVPEGCELESVTALAERLKLPCLLRACKEGQSVKLAEDGHSEEDDNIEEFNTTDLDKLQQELWNDGNKDDLDNEWDLKKDHGVIDEFLNDDDIEEILIFQTQLPKKEEANQSKNVGEKFIEVNGLLNEPKDLSEKDAITEEEWYSQRDTEAIYQTDKQIVYSGDEGDKLFHSGLGLEEEQLNLNVGDNGKKEQFSQLPLLAKCNEHVKNALRVSEENRLSSHEKGEANDQQLPRDNKNNDAVFLRDGISEIVCIECPERFSDSDDQKTRFKDQVRENCCSYKREEQNTGSSALAVGDDILTAKKAVEIVDEREHNIESFQERDNTVNTEIVTDLLVGKNTKVNELNDIDCSVAQGQVLPAVCSQEQIGKESVKMGELAEERTFWDEEVERSSAEEAEINESITLISDNDDDGVSEVSPQPTGICVVPETPRMPTNPRKHVTTSSPSTSTNEDDVCITDLSRGTREQLNAEASEFLSKLKQRIDRGKNKKGGSGRTKQSITPPKTFACESHYSNKTVSERQQNNGRKSLFLSHMHTPVFQERSSDISPISVKDCYASEIVTVEKSPSLSPALDRVQGVSPWLDNPPDAERRNSSGPKAAASGREDEEQRVSTAEEWSDVEVIEKCTDNPADSVYGDISSSSSPVDVMSPPVPSPNYSVLDSVLSPKAFVNRNTPQIAHLSGSLTSPEAPVNRDSSMTGRISTLRSPQQSNSPVSPSVCSFRSPVTAIAAAEKRRAAGASRNLMDESFNEHGIERIGGEIDPGMSLRERLNAARCRMRNNSEAIITDCRYEVGKKFEGEKGSPFLASCQDLGETSAPQEENAGGSSWMDVDLEFYDDGGFNLDIEELNHGEACYPEDIQEEEKGARYSQSEENTSESHHKEMKLKPATRGKNIHSVSSRGQKIHENRTKTTSVPNCGAERQTSREPVTPMPQYDDMTTPVLKVNFGFPPAPGLTNPFITNENPCALSAEDCLSTRHWRNASLQNALRKFGVRPLPKKKMILKLKEIYDYTHQVDSDSQEIRSEHASDVCRPLSSDDAVSDTVDGMQGNGTTASSENSDEEDTEFGECTILIEDEAVTASQQVNGGNLKEKLLSYIRNNKDLYRSLLHFKPVELVSLHQQIKSYGINCPLGKLVDFLDEQGLFVADVTCHRLAVHYVHDSWFKIAGAKETKKER